MKQKPNDIYKDNAFEYEFSIRRKDTNTGEWIPATGITDLNAWISAADGGDAIDAELEALLAERVDRPGTYFAEVPGDTITSHVFTPPVVDETEFFVVAENTAGDIATSSSRHAWNVRRIP